MELTVGDVLRVGEYTVTVIDIDGGEVGFRVDRADGTDFGDEQVVLATLCRQFSD